MESHVRYYECYDPRAFLEQALRNLEDAVLELSLSRIDRSLCFVLTESAGSRFRAEFDKEGSGNVFGSWMFKRAREDCSGVEESHRSAANIFRDSLIRHQVLI